MTLRGFETAIGLELFGIHCQLTVETQFHV